MVRWVSVSSVAAESLGNVILLTRIDHTACQELWPANKIQTITNLIQRSNRIDISSGASYIYILSGQEFIKNAKNGPIWQVFESLKLAVKQSYQWKMPKFKCDILGDFQTLWVSMNMYVLPS